jgi:hypothetical protein
LFDFETGSDSSAAVAIDERDNKAANETAIEFLVMKFFILFNFFT